MKKFYQCVRMLSMKIHVQMRAKANIYVHIVHIYKCMYIYTMKYREKEKRRQRSVVLTQSIELGSLGHSTQQHNLTSLSTAWTLTRVRYIILSVLLSIYLTLFSLQVHRDAFIWRHLYLGHVAHCTSFSYHAQTSPTSHSRLVRYPVTSQNQELNQMLWMIGGCYTYNMS